MLAKKFSNLALSIACAFVVMPVTAAATAQKPTKAKPAAAAAKKPAAKEREASKLSFTPGGPIDLPAKAWLIMDADSGQVLASSNENEPLPPASLTKMMTSYIVEQALRSGKLKETDLISVSENAWCRGSGTESCMYLPLNSQATVIDMLRGIIIQSGNDASKAVAEHLGGSEAGFAKLMNDEAKRLGMKNATFENATGLPSPNHKASALDLAILARAIVRDSSVYYPIYAEREFTFHGIKQGNRNALLYTDPSVDGLKTGHTQEAGYCLVTSAKRDGMRLITVILNTSSMQARADQTRALLAWGYGSYQKATPIEAGTTVGTAKVRYGKVDTVAAKIAEPWTLTVPRGSKVETQIVLNEVVEAPIAKGAVIGKVLASSGGKALGEAPLVAVDGVEQAGLFKRGWQWLTK